MTPDQGVWMRCRAQRTVYALTDQRALILTPAWRNAVAVRSISPEDLSARTHTQRPDGSGSIFFTRLTVLKLDGEGGTYTANVGFENIPEVPAVEALIERTYPAPAPSDTPLL